MARAPRTMSGGTLQSGDYVQVPRQVMEAIGDLASGSWNRGLAARSQTLAATQRQTRGPRKSTAAATGATGATKAPRTRAHKKGATAKSES